MKGLEVEMEKLRQLIVALVGRVEVGCASGSGGGTVDDKVGEDDERDARESSPQPGRRLKVGKVTGRKETGRKEMGRKEPGGKMMGANETGMKEVRAKETGVEKMGGQETGWKVTGGKAMGTKAPGAQDSKREVDNMLPSDTTARQNVTEGIRGSDRGGEEESEGVCGGFDRQEDSQSAKRGGTTWWFAFQGQK